MSQAQTTVEAPQKPSSRILAGMQELISVLRSGSWDRRILAVGAVGFIALSVVLTAWGAKRMLSANAGAKSSKGGEVEECKQLKCTLNALEAHIKKQEKLAEVRDAYANLGEFEVQLVGPGSGQSEVTVELDITVQADSAEAGRWLTANKEPIRNLMISEVGTITQMTRADLMTAEAKTLIRDRIRDRVSQSLPSGKVKEVYFNKYVLR